MRSVSAIAPHLKKVLGKSQELLPALIAQGMQYGAALLLIPVVLNTLPPAQVGLWYVFLTAQGLTMLADFGLQPTLARVYAQAFGGALSISMTGLGEPATGLPNERLVGKINRIAILIYRVMGVGVAVLAGVIGLWYISSLVEGAERIQPLSAWIVFVLGIGATISMMWISPFLLGSGRIRQNYIYLIANRATFSIAAAVLLLAGFGLYSLGVATILGCIAGRIVASRLLRDTIYLRTNIARKGFEPELLKAVLPNALRLGTVNFGSFLTNRAAIFIVGGHYGLEAAGSYGLSYQVLFAVFAVAQTPIQLNQTRMVHARMAGDSRSVLGYVRNGLLIYAVAYGLGAGVLVAFGHQLIGMTGANINLLPLGLFSLMAATVLVEGAFHIAAFVIATENKIPFLASVLVSGAAIVILSLTAAMLNANLLIILLVQPAVQLCYNYWRWFVWIYQDLGRAGARSLAIASVPAWRSDHSRDTDSRG